MKEAKQEDKNGARATKNHLHLRETKEKERVKNKVMKSITLSMAMNFLRRIRMEIQPKKSL